MSLTEVKMSEEVWLTCLTHSLSTETEEIMGLLLGDIEYSKNERATALIWGASPQSRSDRRKDRVETTPEQLAAASAQAERMTVATGRTTRVIGWYHSHPHITVFPSHVDVRTQAMYQLLDSGFTGLIFSCFSEDMNKVGRIQVIAFQSLDGKQNNASRHVAISPVSAGAVIDIESSSSYSGDVSVTSESTRAGSLEQDTADSKGGIRSRELGAFFANANAYNHVWRERSSDARVGGSDNSIIDIDPLDMSESMQEAMHRSTLDISGAEYVRKEVPLTVLPSSNLLKLESPLASFTDLQRVMYEEERSAYNQAIMQKMRNGEVHPLTFIHHTATYQASLCKLIEYCLSPALNALQDRLRENEVRLMMLNEEAKVLEAEVRKGSVSSSRSPRQPTSHTFQRSPSFSHREYQSPFDSSGTRAATGPCSRNRTRPQ